MIARRLGAVAWRCEWHRGVDCWLMGVSFCHCMGWSSAFGSCFDTLRISLFLVKRKKQRIGLLTFCICAALERDIRVGMDRRDIQTYICTEVRHNSIQSIQIIVWTMQITPKVHVCSGLRGVTVRPPACSTAVGLDHCFDSRLETHG
jgi:hypothetical protein